MTPDTPLRRRLTLMAITDPAAPLGLLAAAEAAVRSGATALQLRAKGTTARELLSLAETLRPITAEAGCLLLVNDRLDVALAAGADGVHLGDDDLPLEVARRIAPPPFVIGRSVDTPDEAVAAQAAGAHYVGAGPVYATATKADTGPVLGVEGIGAIVRAVRLPVVGIGGVGIGRAAAVGEAGAAGVAVIGAIMFAEDPGSATRLLLKELRWNP